MRTFKQLLSLCLCLAVVLALAGCGAPKMAPPALEESALAAYSDEEMSFSYPGEAWAAAEGTYPPTLYYKDTYGSEQAVNVNLQRLDERTSPVNDTFIQSFMAGTYSPEMGITPQLSELRSLAGEPAMYLETTVQLTDAMLDTMIQAGLLSEESLAAAGGREFYLSLPATNQITMATVREGYLWVSTGSYHDESQKQALTDAMPTLLTTCAPVG